MSLNPVPISTLFIGLNGLIALSYIIESYTQKSIATKTSDYGVLQRKVRAFENFMEYVPLALLFILTLELMNLQTSLLWLLGTALTVGRVAHSWGVIKGFFLTWFVYLVGACACVYLGVVGVLR